MTSKLSEQIAEIYELDAKRSPLEFSVHYDHPSGNNYYSKFKRVIMAGKNRYPIAAILGDPRSAEENEANAQFLASSTKMVSIIRALEDALNKRAYKVDEKGNVSLAKCECCEALEAKLEKARDCLGEIDGMGFSQSAAMNMPEEDWQRKRANKMQSLAKQTLKELDNE